MEWHMVRQWRFIRDVIVNKNYADTIKQAAALQLGRSWMGEDLAMNLVKENKITPALEPALLAGWNLVREEVC